MNIKLALHRSAGVQDIQICVEPGVDVGALADWIWRADPQADHLPDGQRTFAVFAGDTWVTMQADVAVAESGLRSGALATIVPAGHQHHAAGSGHVVASLDVLSGPDAGREFPLRSGSWMIGRGGGAHVSLADPLVSKRHALLRIGPRLHITDQNSANGIQIGGATVAWSDLLPETEITLGDTVVRISRLQPADAADGSPVIAFNRPPRVEPVYVPLHEEAPEPPERPQKQPFPIFSLLIPVALGAALFLVTRSALSAAFLALSPLLLIGALMEQGLFGRRAFRRARRAYRAALSVQRARFAAAAAAEADARRAQLPAADELRRAITDRTSLLWARRPDRDGFARLRAGTATLPSSNILELPANAKELELLAEARHVAEDVSQLTAVPVPIDLSRAGSLGISGGPRRYDIARAIVLQLVTTHSPEDLVVTALLPDSAAARWAWLRWLPHMATPASFGGAAMGADAESCQRIVSAAHELLHERSQARNSASSVWVPRLIIVVEEGAPVERGELAELGEEGADLGIHLIWSAPSTDRLPAACRSYLEVPADGNGVAGDASGGTVISDLRLEGTDDATADALARALSPVVDACAAVDRQAELPRSASFIEVAGRELLKEPAAIADRWVQTGSLAGHGVQQRRSRSLRALVGVSAGAPFHLDLREHGPHALVGGTTGSGKSEFLQSWILGMAADHSPEQVTFLLVDYKGGAAFAEIVRLPHTVGLVTDLTPRLVGRALTSLKAELRYRERILNDAGAPDLLELERRGHPDTPPALVIVVDEFAALVQEVPEFVEGVIDIAARGRSLGLHLILATQRPAGVIKDNLRANTNLRVALRVADVDDSIDVLGTSDAALFDPGIPGRAMAKTGPGRVTPFQALYAGGRSGTSSPPPEISVTTLGFGLPEHWDQPDATGPDAHDDGPTDVHRLVDAIGQSAARCRLPEARRPWLPQLPPVIDLADLADLAGPDRHGDDELVLGLTDDPAHQRRVPAIYRPDTDGAMLVLGTGGSGKSTALRVLAMSAGSACLPDRAGRSGSYHVYGLDFGSRGLAPLEGLPHVGTIVAGDDHERVVRLLDYLRAAVDERAVRYAAASASTIADYRQLTGVSDEPRILLLLDNFGGFRAEYETGWNSRIYDQLLALAQDGRAAGVHLAVSADRPGVIPPALASAIQKRVTLKLVADVDLASVGLGNDAFAADSPPGRAFADGLELQIAVPGGDPSVTAQAACMRQLADQLTAAGVAAAPAVGRLGGQVYLSSLPPDAQGRPTLGIAGDTLHEIGFDTSGTFIVAGPPQSGRTSALLTVVHALRRAEPDRQLIYAGIRRSPLIASHDLPWAATATTMDEVMELANAWAQRAATTMGQAFGAVIENVPDFIDTSAQEPLERMIAAFAAAGQLVVGDGESSAFTSSWGLSKAMKSGRHGLLLQPDQLDGESVLRTDLPRLVRAEFPPGRGVYVRSGQVRTVQVALPS